MMAFGRLKENYTTRSVILILILLAIIIFLHATEAYADTMYRCDYRDVELPDGRLVCEICSEKIEYSGCDFTTTDEGCGLLIGEGGGPGGPFYFTCDVFWGNPGGGGYSPTGCSSGPFSSTPQGVDPDICCDMREETCNNADDNCNGIVDENCYINPDCPTCPDPCPDSNIPAGSDLNIATSNVRLSSFDKGRPYGGRGYRVGGGPGRRPLRNPVEDVQRIFQSKNSPLPIDFHLIYNSLDGDGPLGMGWSHSYNVSIELRGGGLYAGIRRSYGRHTRHVKYEAGGPGSIYKVLKTYFPDLLDNGDGTYSLTYKNGITYTFGAGLKLTEIKDRNGNTITLTYTDGLLTSIKDSSAWQREIVLTYNADRKIETITDPDSKVHTFTYIITPDRTLLESITTRTPDPNDEDIVRSYTYDSGRLKTKTDPEGNTTVYEYDGSNRLSKTYLLSDPGSTTRTFTYDPAAYKTTLTERDGGVREYTYEETHGRVIEIKDPDGHITQYEYDDRGYLWKKILPEDPDMALDGWTWPDYYTYAYTYYPDGSLRSVKDPRYSGNALYYTYDPTFKDKITGIRRGYITDIEWTYFNYFDDDSDGDIDRMIETKPSGSQTTYVYNEDGRINTITNDLGQTTTIIYEHLQDPVTLGYYDRMTITDHLGAQTHMTMDVSGNITGISDPRNSAWKYTFEYNDLGRLTKIIDPKNNIKQFTYDIKGNLDVITDANGNTVDYDYDYNNNLTKITDMLNNVTEFIYGGTGCASCGGGGDNLVSIIDANGKTWEYTNYKTGKRESQRTPVEGEPPTTFLYNPRGLLKSLIDPAGSGTKFTYDQNGNLASIEDPLGKTTTFFYNTLNRLTRKVDRDNNTVHYYYGYDTAAHETEVEVGLYTYYWRPVIYTYDPIGRLTNISDVTGIHGVIGSTTTYDYYDLGEDPAAFPACIADASDPLRMVAVTDTFGFVTCYKYDEAGNLTELTYPNNKKVIYTYDELNRIETATDWLGNVTTYYYDPAGNIDYVKNFNNTKTDYGYDNANRLTDISHIRSDLSVIASYHFELDGVGNRISSDREEPLAPSVSDELTDYVYNPEKNRLLTGGITNFTYTDEGLLKTQVISSETDTFSYGWDQSLKKIRGQMDADYYYDPRKFRLRAERNGVLTYYIHDIYGNVIAEADASMTITKYYIHGSGLMAMVVPATVDEVYTYHHNAIGSTVAMTDQTETIVNSYAYTPFGIITNESETIPQPFKYVGQYGVMHEPNGFYYMRARYYDPNVGRFVSEDPIGFAGGTVNLYEYTGNNPINRIDPHGLWYIDLNVTGGAFLGATLGVMISDSGIYPYIGGGIVTPGGSGAITWSPSDPTHGWTAGLSLTAGIAGQLGYSFGDGGGWFWEGGIGWPPGGALTGYYVFEPFWGPKNPCDVN